METGPQTFENKLEQKSVELKVVFAVEKEVDRIKKALAKIEWYRSNGYKLNFPAQIVGRLDDKESISDEDLETSVSIEYKKEEYEKMSEELQTKWGLEGEDFMKKLSTLGRPICDSYEVFLTKYGVGGSYGFPNTVVLNFDYFKDKSKTFFTVKHEIIHLTIEDLIQKYDIEHWIKERLVDLIFCRFFQSERGIQKEENKMEDVSRIFEAYFPDIEKVISEVSKIETNKEK